MAKITHEQLHSAIMEIRTVLLGVPDSEDMGLYGEVKEARKLLRELNGTARNNRTWIVALRWIVGLLIVALITGQLGVW